MFEVALEMTSGDLFRVSPTYDMVQEAAIMSDNIYMYQRYRYTR